MANAPRLAIKSPVGLRPSLENHRIQDLRIDPEYQRSIDNGQSLALIRRIAVNWDWSLFQPLAVSRRPDGTLYVVDGQHRRAAAEIRGDMHDLPCVVSPYQSSADEAASFVAMNAQRRPLNALDLFFVAMNAQRRPLNALDLFKASLASGDPESIKVMVLISAAGLSLATHSNYTAWKPGQLSNIAGIRQAYRQLGRDATSAALVALPSAFPDQVLQYGGSIFGGLARAYVTLLAKPDFDPDLFIDLLNGATQRAWYDEILAARAQGAGNMGIAGEQVFLAAYAEANADDEE